MEVRTTLKKGFGVFSMEHITEGALVGEYVGEIIDEMEKKQRVRLRGSEYLMAYGSGRYIDAWQYGNVSRFVNHSCEENRAADEWTVNGVYRVTIVAS